MKTIGWLLAAGLALVSASERGVAQGQAVPSQGRVPLGALQSNAGIPPASVFAPPPANACQSKYDQFYESEPGVYAYWALCETGQPTQLYDYVGTFDLISGSSWGKGVTGGVAPGPVQDGEQAAGVQTASSQIEGQGIPMNTHQGTIAAWVNADATDYPVTAVFLGAVSGASVVSIGVNTGEGLCVNGGFTGADGKPFTVQSCGRTANSWHRIVLTWSDGELNLFIDGSAAATAKYAGTLDNKVFYYRLFPGCCNTGKPMTLAKVTVANVAWSPSQVKMDFAPMFPAVPTGGVYVTEQKLGVIHRDVFGYGDYGQNIATQQARAPLLTGLAAGGYTALRYAGGYAGIYADLENWKGGVLCTKTPGVNAAPSNAPGNDSLDSYLPDVAQHLGLDVVFTVNYGTNPPTCNAGGDPIANGAALVQYANGNKHYGIKYWEIGNEVYSPQTESDFHPNPNTGASYVAYEPAFYQAMKAADPGIQIAVPVGLSIYSYQSGFDLPVLANASYDAVVWHNYPMIDPISDGATLYQDRVAAKIHRTRGSLLKLQTELLNNGKGSDAIWITEWNGEVSGNKWSRQTIGAVEPLFVASQLAEYMQAGVKLATWHTQGGTSVCSTLNYDASGDSAYSWWRCGATSLVYTGAMTGVGEVAVGMKPGDITPAARAFELLVHSGFVAEGEHMVRTQSDSAHAPWMLSYAATHGPSFALILINRDRDAAHVVPVELGGMPVGTGIEQWTYGRAQYDASRVGDWEKDFEVSKQGAWSGSFEVTLPAWSVSVIVLTK